MKRTAIKRRTRLKQAIHRPDPSLVALERRLATEWHEHANRRRCCVGCGRNREQLRRAGHFKLAGHHVIERQEIDRFCRERRLDPEATIRWRWDRRNCLGLCSYCHGRHHTWAARLTRAVVRAAAIHVDEFAKAIERSWYIDRHYPEKIIDPAA